MTVAELIEALKAMPQDAVVLSTDSVDDYYEADPDMVLVEQLYGGYVSAPLGAKVGDPARVGIGWVIQGIRF